jgi:hypothetical protein
LRVVKEVRVRFMDKEASAIALFDTGSSYTVIRRGFFEKVFKATWTLMSRLVKLYLTNGRFAAADKYAVVTIFVNNVELSPPGTVLILDEFVEEIELEGKRIRVPDIIISAGTMNKYNIVLDPKESVKVIGAGLLQLQEV